MHYLPHAGSRNGLPTIEALQPGIVVGRGSNMTAIDIQEVRLFYNCQASGITLPPTTPAPLVNNRKLLGSHGVKRRILSCSICARTSH